MKCIIINGSVPGCNKIITGAPCQDSNDYIILNDFWGLAIVSDGAGSMNDSHIASKFITDYAVNKCQQYLEKEKWYMNKEIPEPNVWRSFIISFLNQMNTDLKNHAAENDLNYEKMGATLIMILFCKMGIVSVNIGDGRSCFQEKSSKKWFPITKPFKGEEVGSTIFLNTEWIWEPSFIDECIKTDIINIPFSSFALLSDGMENYAFTCYTKNPDDFFYDPNEPYDKFFNSNISTFKKMIKNGKALDEIKKCWAEYLSNGKNLKNEYDDKTMVIGILK